MKKLIITLVVIFIVRSSFASCGPQNYTISELMLMPNNLGYLLVKIDSSFQINYSQYGFGYSLISKATVLSSYKNHPKTNKITIRTGSLNSSTGGKKLLEGHTYFVVSGSDDGINYHGFGCDPFSYEIKKEDSIIYFGRLSGTKNLLKMVKSYFDLVKNKFTGRFILGENGRFYAEGNMINGKLEGEILHYLTKKSKVMDRDEPLVKSRYFYKDGKLDGLCENYFNFYGKIDYRKYWYEKGELVKSEMYTEDDGYFKLSSKTEYKQNALGNSISSINYNKKGNIVGINNNIILKELKNLDINIHATVNNGYCEKYYDNGKLREKGEYWLGAKIGKWEYYSENGKLLESKIYKKLKKDTGLVTIYHPNGKIKLKDERDKNHRIWTVYNEQGQISSSVPMIENKIDGNYLIFSNGNIYCSKRYENGIAQGKYYEYYDTGKIRIKGQFNNNVFDGIWETYSVDGRLLERKEYSKGLYNSEYVIYDESGMVIKRGNYKNGVKIGVWKEWNNYTQVFEICLYKENRNDFSSFESSPVDCRYEDKNGKKIKEEEVLKKHK